VCVEEGGEGGLRGLEVRGMGWEGLGEEEEERGHGYLVAGGVGTG
jgi:hypothetical protein